MKTQSRAEILIHVHKGLRRALLGLDLKLGSLDWIDREEVTAAGVDLKDLLHFLREHAANEDQVQIPMLENRVPGATALIQDDHYRLEAQVDGLETQWGPLTTDEASFEAGYRFYLAYNRFLSDYLAHMNPEETEFTEAIHQNFSDREIEAEFKKIIARTTPADMGMMLSSMIPAMNPPERAGFLLKLKASAPEEVFEKVRGLAQRVLDPRSWEKPAGQLV